MSWVTVSVAVKAWEVPRMPPLPPRFQIVTASAGAPDVMVIAIARANPRNVFIALALNWGKMFRALKHFATVQARKHDRDQTRNHQRINRLPATSATRGTDL